VTATPLKDSTPVYMVVDLSKGADASSYPVRYTTTAPTTVPGELNPCKTTELWLRRIKAGTVKMGGGSACDVQAGYKTHTVTLTDDFYIGIFPLTYAQYQNIGQGVSPTRSLMHFTNETCIATRPLDSVTFPCLRDSAYSCPQDPTIHDSRSILGRLRARTGLDFDLPTEWQWEYAIRAGKFTGGNGDRYSGATRRTKKKPASTYEYYSQERMWDAQYGTTYVDAGNPNAWGIFLVYGNIWEWCINRSASITQGESYTDPLGVAADGSNDARTLRGCAQSWGYLENYSGAYVSSGTRLSANSSQTTETVGWYSGTYYYYQGIGARIILQIRK
jgi:formylglycine-generating enzyme required for sulfatase activity